MGESRPLGLRGGLQRLSRGLIAYGIIGLVVAAIGFGAVVWVNGRISHLRGEADATVARLATTMELAAMVLRGASTTAASRRRAQLTKPSIASTTSSVPRVAPKVERVVSTAICASGSRSSTWVMLWLYSLSAAA